MGESRRATSRAAAGAGKKYFCARSTRRPSKARPAGLRAPQGELHTPNNGRQPQHGDSGGPPRSSAQYCI
eukprot:11268401-Alexandrium_andersonii.AAC.1